MSFLKVRANRKVSLQLANLNAVCFIMLVLPLTANRPMPQQTLSPQEYEIRAVFLFNFTQFVEWPSVAFPKTNSPLIIGVLGQDPFGHLLEETVLGEVINGHPLVVQRFNKVEEISTCHILYVNLKSDELKNVFEHLKNRNVLTVGDNNTFARQGGMIRFFTEEKKTRIRINLESAKEADLIISSKLLRLADIVDSK